MGAGLSVGNWDGSKSEGGTVRVGTTEGPLDRLGVILGDIVREGGMDAEGISVGREESDGLIDRVGEEVGTGVGCGLAVGCAEG